MAHVLAEIRETASIALPCLALLVKESRSSGMDSAYMLVTLKIPCNKVTFQAEALLVQHQSTIVAE